MLPLSSEPEDENLQLVSVSNLRVSQWWQPWTVAMLNKNLGHWGDRTCQYLFVCRCAWNASVPVRREVTGNQEYCARESNLELLRCRRERLH